MPNEKIEDGNVFTTLLNIVEQGGETKSAIEHLAGEFRDWRRSMSADVVKLHKDMANAQATNEVQDSRLVRLEARAKDHETHNRGQDDKINAINIKIAVFTAGASFTTAILMLVGQFVIERAFGG